MKLNVNRRWVLGSVLGVLVLGILGYGGYAFFNKQEPEDPFSAAQKAYAQSDEAIKNSDLDTARKACEAADARLKPLLEKEPANGPALILRYRVVSRLLAFAAQDEAKQGNTAPDRPSEGYRQEAARLINEALKDPQNVEAFALVLNNLFINDKLDEAVPFAQRVADGGDPNTMKDYVLAAHYVLAWQAIEAKPTRYQEALSHIELSRQLDNPPRWRALGVQARALALKAREERTHSPGLQHAPAPDSATTQLQELFREGTERAGGELENLPKLIGGSSTNIRGILDFLVLSVEHATDARQAQDRARLMLDVCDKLLSIEKPRPHMLEDVARRAARLSLAREALPAARRPSAEEWQRLTPRIEEVKRRTLDASTNTDASFCLEIARTARRDGQLEATERLARQGLEKAAAAKLPPEDSVVLGLRAEIAWVLAFRAKPEEREELGQTLDLLHKHPAALGDARGELIEGLLAIQEGRLKMAIRRLATAQKGLPASQSLYSALGLAYCYMATGAYEKALPQLTQIKQQVGEFQQLNEAEKALAAQLLPNRSALLLELFRCQLELAQLDAAQATYKELLPYKPEYVTATVHAINHQAAGGWKNWTAQQKEPSALKFAAAHQHLDAARLLAPNDARVVWAEVNLLLLERAAAEKASVADTLAEAETLLRNFAAKPGNEGQGALALTRWYLFRHQLAQAADQLSRAEKASGGNRDQVQILRSQLQLAHSTIVEAEEVDRLVEQFGDADGWTNDPALLNPGAALSPYERVALRLYTLAIRDQAGGDFQKAAKTFELALPYVRFQGSVRRGLLGSLVGLINTRLGRDAEMLATTWLKSWDSQEPVLLLAAARAAGAQDNLEGMNKYLRSLEDAIGKDKAGKTLAAYLAALEWRRVGREDQTRKELDRTLNADAAFAPALQTACEIDQAEETWEDLKRHARSLTRLRPNLPEAQAWLATAWDHLGNHNEAHSICMDLSRQFPNDSASYEAMIAILRRGGQQSVALQWAQSWRSHVPDDPQALRTLITLLALSNQDAEGAAAEGLKGLGEERAFDGALAVGRGYLDGHAYPRARTWAERAIELTGKMIDAQRRGAALKARLLLAESLAKLGEFPEAIRVYKEVRQAAPDNFLASRNLAQLLSQKADQQDAAYGILDQLLRKNAAGHRAVTGDRLPLDFLLVLADVYLKGRHFTEVVAILEEALQRYPEDPRLRLQLGRGYAGRGMTPQATENFESAAGLAKKRARRASDESERAFWEGVANEARQEMRGTE